MPYDIPVRSELVNRGVDPSSIGWNQNTQTVTVNGQDFMRPPKVYNGTSFADSGGFNNAYNSWKQNQQTQQPTWQQNLQTYQQNPQAGWDELDRANNVMNYKQATGDMQGAQNAATWINQIQTALGSKANRPDTYSNPYDQQVNNVMGSYLQQASNPKPIDVYSSPQYQAAQAEANRQAGLSVRQAQESLGQSGFARSTNLADRAQHIQNDANAYLQTQIAPNIYNQLREQQQQQLANLGNVINFLGQQQGVQDTRHQQQLTNQYNMAKFQWDKTKDMKDLAYKGLDSLGLLSPQDAQILGLPAGTLSEKAKSDALSQANTLFGHLGYASPGIASLLGLNPGDTTQQARYQQGRLDNMNNSLAQKTAYDNASLGLRSQELQNAIQRTQNDADYKSFLKQQGITSQHAKVATNTELSNVLSMDYNTAMDYLTQHANQFGQDGVNVSDLYNAINRKYSHDNPNNLNSLLNSNP